MHTTRPTASFVFAGNCIPDRDKSYIAFFEAMLRSRRPSWRLAVVNRCCPGKCTAHELRNIWEDDVVHLRPTWLCVMVGIDDVRKCIRRENDWEQCVPAQFQVHCDYLIGRAKDRCGSRIVLLDPFFIAQPREDHWTDQVVSQLPAYHRTVAAISRKYKAIRVPLQTVFQQQCRHRPSEALRLYPDIPNALGHLIVAESLFQALG